MATATEMSIGKQTILVYKCLFYISRNPLAKMKTYESLIYMQQNPCVYIYVKYV